MYKPLPDVTVIGFGHKARNGKDTAAGIFQTVLGGAARRYAFADALKAVARVSFGMKEKDGKLLQALGTDVYRHANPDIWTDVMYWTLKEHRPQFALITDVRFPNEAEMIKDMKGILIRCIRRNPDGSQFIDPHRDPNHLSETALDHWAFDCTFDAISVEQLSVMASLTAENIAIGSQNGYFIGTR